MTLTSLGPHFFSFKMRVVTPPFSGNSMRSCRLNVLGGCLYAYEHTHTHTCTREHTHTQHRQLGSGVGGRGNIVWDQLCHSSLTQWKMKRHPLLPCPSTPVRFPTLCSEQGKHLSVLTNLNQGGSQAQQPCLGIPSPLKSLSIHLPLGQP